MYILSPFLSPVVDLHHVLDVYTWASNGHLKFSMSITEHLAFLPKTSSYSFPHLVVKAKTLG